MKFTQSIFAAAFAFAAAAAFAAPVTTQGVGVGKHGDIQVAVTFDNGKIQKIDILKNAENPVLAKKVFTDLKDQIVAANSVQLDGISGATFTSKGLFAAVEDAAKKAGVTLGQADKKALKAAVKDLPKNASYDVVVIGAGQERRRHCSAPRKDAAGGRQLAHFRRGNECRQELGAA